MKKGKIPELQELLDNCIETYQKASVKTKSLVTNGELFTYPDPDLRAMNEANRLIGMLLGYIGTVQNLDPAKAKKELAKLKLLK